MSPGALFTPIAIGSLRLPNRLVMSPMTRSWGYEGVPDPLTGRYYAARIEGGCGLVISEGVTVPHPVAEFSKYVPCFFGDEALAGWRAVLAEVHGAGGLMAMQLWHAGVFRDTSVAIDPALPSISPSGIAINDMPAGEAMTDADIDAVIGAYAAAAAHARTIGFDAIELHGAHGYTIDAFFWYRSNTRGGRYGGATLRERARFGAEVVREIRRRVGPDYPLFMRVSQWKLWDYHARNATDPAQLADWLEPLADAGIDLFDCSQRRFWDPEFEGSDLNLAGWVKKVTGKPTMTVGSVGLSGSFLDNAKRHTDSSASAEPESLDRLLEMLTRGDFDLVAVGRVLLANPDWPTLIRDGREAEIRPFTRDVLQVLA